LVSKGPCIHFFRARVRAAFRAAARRPRRPLVRAAFAATAERARTPRFRTVERDCLASAVLEAALRPSRRRAELVARWRRADGFLLAPFNVQAVGSVLLSSHSQSRIKTHTMKSLERDLVSWTYLLRMEFSS
jgi:hypothetical protein